MSHTLLSGLLLLTVISEGLCVLPKTIKPCSRKLARPEACIINSATSLRPLLAKGDLGDGFETPPLEPLTLDNIRMSRGSEFSAIFTKLLVNGPSSFVVEKLKADIDNLAFDFTLLLPKLNFTGKYGLKIRLLLFNIQGQGDLEGSFTNSRGVVRIRGQKVNRNGVDYVTFNQLQVKIQVAGSKFHLGNLFNGDPVLSEVGNQFINENSDLFLAEIIPGMEKNLAKTFLNITNVILKDVTFDEMFPDI